MALVQDPNKNPLNPPMAPNPMLPPPPPQGTPPGAGFQSWASDPLNAMKVQSSMTSPSSPLQPNQQPMASATPPQVAPKPSPLLPPSMQDDMKANPGAYQNRIAKGKVGNILNMIAATSLGAAGGMKGNPGLGANYAMDVFNHDQGVGDANQKTYNNRIVAPQQQALANKNTESEITARDSNAKLKAQNSQAALAQHGLKLVEDENGNQTVVPDENSPVFKQQKQKSDLTEAQIAAAKAGVELKAAQTAFEKSKMDPNSPLFQQTANRLKIAQQNAAAAQTRATAYMGNYLQGAYGTGLTGDVLPGATTISNEAGDQTVVGTKSASQATKNQSNAAQFNDVKGATDNIEKVADALVKKGGKLNSPSVAAAIADPKSTSSQWAQGQFVNSGLSPEERDYVTTVKAYKENLQALRKSAGGSVSDSQVDRLMEMAPGASTPDLDYLKRQTAQIRQMWGRLAPGASTSAGGLQINGRGNGTAPKPGGNPLKPPTRATPAKGKQNDPLGVLN